MASEVTEPRAVQETARLLCADGSMTPRRPPPEARPAEESVDMEAVVADDDDDNRALFVAALRRVGFTASEARNGNELVACVDALRRQGRHATVVVSDIGMPECDGVEAARRLRLGSLTLPIILVTASTDPHDWSAAAEAGVDALLQKPVKAHELIRAVRHAVGV
jgi:CheY-like chemotaxis protein